MLNTRVIPVLLLKNKGLYKGEKFQNHKYIGDPLNAIKIFNEKEVDELVVFDITATLQKKDPNFTLLEQMAAEAFMPMAYGGGIQTIEQAEKIFMIGFEKIVINSSCNKLDFIFNLVKQFGSQSVVVCLDIKKNFLGKYSLYINCGTQKISESLLDFVKKIEDVGIGELIINSIDKDGTLSGYDINILQKVSSFVSIPVIAAGGASSIDDFIEAKKAGASAVAAGAMFVFQGPHRAVLISYPKYETLVKALN